MSAPRRRLLNPPLTANLRFSAPRATAGGTLSPMRIQYTKAPYDGVKMHVTDIARVFSLRRRVKRPARWLTRKLQLYLKGFQKRGNRPKTGKISQKVARKKYDTPSFTMSAFTMMACNPGWAFVIRTPVEWFPRPPHSVSLPKGREDARTSAAGGSGVPSPLGEKDRMRGSSKQP
jgi:hypothetical protein